MKNHKTLKIAEVEKSKAEMLATFHRMDVDKNGELSKKEYLSFQENVKNGITARHFLEIDEDNDNSISMWEATAHFHKHEN